MGRWADRSMEKLKKYKHTTGEIIEVSVSCGVGFVNGKYFDIIDSDGAIGKRSRLKGTSYFEVIESDGANI